MELQLCSQLHRLVWEQWRSQHGGALTVSFLSWSYYNGLRGQFLKPFENEPNDSNCFSWCLGAQDKTCPWFDSGLGLLFHINPPGLTFGSTKPIKVKTPKPDLFFSHIAWNLTVPFIYVCRGEHTWKYTPHAHMHTHLRGQEDTLRVTPIEMFLMANNTDTLVSHCRLLTCRGLTDLLCLWKEGKNSVNSYCMSGLTRCASID